MYKGFFIAKMPFDLSYIMVNQETKKKYVNGGLILTTDILYEEIEKWFNNNQITDREGIKSLINRIYSDLLQQQLYIGKVYSFTY
jgi:hypothetical protein